MVTRIRRAATLISASAVLAAIVLVSEWVSQRLAAENAPPESREAAPAEARPTGAVSAILETFDRYPIVALGESHGLEEEREFISTLVRDPRFPDKVNDIVVEFGNAKYQNVMDRYIAGEDVPAAELQRVWREHTCPGPWSSSAYPKYFAAFREANKALPPARRFRVLLGDPPIDWELVRTPKDLGSFLGQRDSHFARVVEEQVLAKGRKGLLIMGGMHLLRKDTMAGLPTAGPKTFVSTPPPSGDKRDSKQPDSFGPVSVPPGVRGQPTRIGGGNVVQLIDKHHPGKLFIVLPHDGLGEGSAEIEKRFEHWPAPSLVLLKGTWLGAIAANQVTPGPKLFGMFRNGKRVEMPKPDPAKGPHLEEVADALLYLGPRSALTLAPEADCSQDKAFLSELQRRKEVTGGPTTSAPDINRKQTRRYIDQ